MRKVERGSIPSFLTIQRRSMDNTSTPAQPAPRVVLSMTKEELTRLCILYGASLDRELAHTSDGGGKPIDGARLLWAMSGRESSFGQNMKPRHEPAYDVGGRYANLPEVKQGLEQFGSAFACSYGPLQIMACNARGFTPSELEADPEKALAAAVAMLRLTVLGAQKAATLEHICQAWNAGHVGAKCTPGYEWEVRHYYLTQSAG
jgi:hypothetical protein